MENGGTGPYSAIVTEDPTLPGMTIFRPRDLAPFGAERKLTDPPVEETVVCNSGPARAFTLSPGHPLTLSPSAAGRGVHALPLA